MDEISKDWLTNIGLSAMEKPLISKTDMYELVENCEPDMSKVTKVREEKYKREVENNKNIKELVNYNEKISSYNKKLVNLNVKILEKIESLDDILSFLNNSFNKKSEFDKNTAIEQTTLLLELTQIIDDKDNSRFESFMTDVGAPVGVGLVVEYLKTKFGLS